MSYSATFDDFEWEGDLEVKESKPIWTVNIKDEEKLKTWLTDDWQNKFNVAQPRIQVYRENLALYKGIHYRSQETRTQDFRRDAGDSSLRNPKIVINHVYDMVETKTAKMNRFKPAIAVLPNNDEWNDKVNAGLGKKLVQSRWDDVEFDEILRAHQRSAYVFGDGFLKVFWNEQCGEIHPLQKLAIEHGLKVPKLGEDGQEIVDEHGNKITFEEAVRIGDVDYEVYTPDRVFPQRKDRWEDVEHITVTDFVHIEDLKAMYPDKQEKLKKRSGTRFDPEGMQEVRLRDEVLILEFWHKPTRFLPKGLRIVFTEDVILKVEEFPYKHGKLPFIKLSDIDVPTELHGRSFIHVIKQPQRHFNNLASGVARNHGLASAPKWVMPKGACKISQLNNEITVVEYAGGVPPRLENMNPTHPEVFNYMDKLETYVQKLSGVHGISRGTPPPGIRAGVALQFLDEQEAERENNGVAKRHRVIRDAAKMTLSLMGQYYKEDDGRLLKIVGKDNSYMIESFEMADFTKGYDVRIQNASSLPDSKASRIQTIIDLGQAFPNLFQTEQLIDMLDLGAVEQFMDQARVAVKAAESENEAILSGKQISPPQEWEDLIVHYEVHLKKLQERQFKEEVPTAEREEFLRHLKATEFLMWKKMNQNANFRNQVLQRFAQYPIVFKLDANTEMLVAQGGGLPPEQPQFGPQKDIVPPPNAEQAIKPVPGT